MLNDKDDGTTGRQDDEKSSPAAFGTRGTNACQPVGSSSCRPFFSETAGLAGSNGRPGQKKIGELSLVVMTGRKNSMGGMASGPWN